MVLDDLFLFFFFFEEEGEKLYERRLGKNIMVNHIADLER